jgi:hypothetical protein
MADTVTSASSNRHRNTNRVGPVPSRPQNSKEDAMSPARLSLVFLLLAGATLAGCGSYAERTVYVAKDETAAPRKTHYPVTADDHSSREPDHPVNWFLGH